MKLLYHFCITAHGEVLFRDEEDIRAITNILALEAFSCQVEIWADAVMSTHIHGIASAEATNITLFCRQTKMRITKYHRSRHLGQGPLFDPGQFLLPLDGVNHILAAISYVLRNGLHHGQSATPFSYPHCTANYLFRKDLGKEPERAVYTSRQDIARMLPRRSEFPDYFAMDRDGMLMRSSFEQVKMLEHYYRTPRCFDYYMCRLSGEEWQQEQQKDAKGGAPITLENIEPASAQESVATMLARENGRFYSPTRLSDMEICQIIDTEYIPGFRKQSVYQLSESERSRIGSDLAFRFRIPDLQLRRCLVL